MDNINDLLKAIEDVVMLFPMNYIDSIMLSVIINSETIHPSIDALESNGFVSDEENAVYTFDTQFFEPVEQPGGIELVKIDIHINYTVQ